MKLAFSTLACPEWTLERAVEAAHEYGYAGIEIRLLDGEIVPPDLPAAVRKRVRDVIERSGLALVCLDTSVRIAQADAHAREEQIDAAHRLAEIAAEWHAPSLRVFGMPPEPFVEADAIRQASEGLAALTDAVHHTGVRMLLETHDVFCSSTRTAQVLAAPECADAGVVWDVMHTCRAGESAETTLATLGSHIEHVHLKDGTPPPNPAHAVAGRPGEPPHWRQVLPGEGEIPLEGMLRGLHARGYTGWLSVEWEKKWIPELDGPEVALPHHARYFGKLIDGLGRN